MLFSCLAAILCASLCSLMNTVGIGVLAASIFLLLILFLPVKFQHLASKRFAILALLLSFAVVLSNLIYSHFVYEIPQRFCDSKIDSECVVLENENDSLVVLLNEGFKCRLYFKDDIADINPSAKLKITAKISDDIRRYTDGGIHVSGYVSEYETISEVNRDSPIYLYHRFRNALKRSFDFESDELSSFMNGIILGETENISGVIMNKFTTVGMSHFMSVSGMHLMFAVNFIGIFLSIFNISYKKRAILSILAAFVFVAISGFAVSCIRAFIMVAILNAGVALGKDSDSLTSLAIAAYIIVAVSPYNTLNVSFVLSVLATFGLVVIGPAVSGLVPVKLGNKFYWLSALINVVKRTLSASIGANIACIPVFLVVFKQVSLMSPVTNLLLTLPIQAVFYLGFLSLVLSPVPYAKEIVICIYKPIYDLIIGIVDFFFKLKYTTVNDGNPFFYLVFVLLMILVLGVFLHKHLKSKVNIRYYFAGYFSLCLILFLLSFASSFSKTKLKVVDVGQGSCNLIVNNERAVIVDCGGEHSDCLIKELRHSSVKTIEMIAITHTDSDHTSFVERILETYDVEKFVYPEFCDDDKMQPLNEILNKTDTEVIKISEDSEFVVLDNCLLEAFVDKAYNCKKTPNLSALYKFNCNETSVCFTGDMNIHQEYAYLDYGNKLDCDILVVPHHGASNASYNRILELYSPEYSVISVSENNIYNLPDLRVVKRLSEISSVVTTKDESTLIFEFDKKGYKLLN